VPDTPEDPSALQSRRDEIADKYNFDDCCTAAFEVVFAAWGRHAEGLPIGTDDVSVSDVAEAMDHGPVGPGLIDWVLGPSDQGSPLLDSFTTILIDTAPPPQAATRFVRAMNAEADGRVLDAEADLTEAVAEDPTHAPSTYELARFASDRGDIDKAVDLYRRVGAGAQPEIEFLTGLMPDYGKIGRNEPCPCGSGRKFKQCHLDNPEVPPDRAALWLFQKVLGFGYREQFEPVRASLARAAADAVVDPASSEEASHERSTEVDQRMGHEPFLLDLAVFDTGIIERFAAERSVLLPPVEIQMLQDWMTTDRRLWELTGVEVGRAIVLQDTESGESLEVPERVASRSLHVGDLLLTRVVAVHGELQLIGQPMPISPERRETVSDLVNRKVGAEEWARWFGTLFTPARGRNVEGEEIIVGAAIVRPSAEVDTEALLADRYQPSDDVEGRWNDEIDLDGERIVRATLDVEADGRIVVTANSDARLDRVLDALRSADPDLTIEGDERQPFLGSVGADSKVSDLIGK